MRRRRLVTAVTTLAVVLVCATLAAGSAFTTGPLVQVSGQSPFGGCTADAAPTQSGTPFMHSEVEPWIDVNPANTSTIVGVWQQDRWSNGGSRGLVAGRSVDGGANWTFAPIPGISACSGGTYQRATDPWDSFGPTGTLHQLSLSFNDFDFDHALLASRSTDGGLTWSTPRIVRRDTDANVFNDKQSITADPTPTRAGFVYAVWDRLVFPTSERASVVAGFHAASFRGPTWFARSIDDGNSWQPARQIYDPGQNDQTIANQIVVQPDGTLIDGFTEFQNENKGKLRGGSVKVLRSADAGATWTGPILVGRLLAIGVSDPETGQPVRTGDIIPDFAVNRSTGTLYAVWQDARFNGSRADGIVFSQSTNGGLTWSAPLKVNLTPTNIPIGNQQAFTGSVHVSSDGTLAVTYYDFRNNTSDPATLWTDYFVVHCHSACTSASSWEDEKELTNLSFDMTKAPFAGGFFTGDYEGLASAGTTFDAFFSQSHGSDPASTFFRRVGP
jgi:hypothetical protein